MHSKIQTLNKLYEQKERIDDVYEWFKHQVVESNGIYKSLPYSVTAKEFDCSASTVAEDIKILVELGLLIQKGRRLATFSLPVDDEMIDSREPEVIDDEVVSEEEVETDEELVADTDLVKYIEDNFLVIRDERVMLDRDLAAVYGVETRVLNQQRERNPDKFPDDFAFQITDEERSRLSQNVTTSLKFSPVNPYVYTIEGCNMASTVLHTPIAVKRAVTIIRVFSDLERMAHGEAPRDDRMIDVIQMITEQNKAIMGGMSSIRVDMTDALDHKVDKNELEKLKAEVREKDDKLNQAQQLITQQGAEINRVKVEGEVTRKYVERQGNISSVKDKIKKRIALATKISGSHDQKQEWQEWSNAASKLDGGYVRYSNLRLDQLVSALRAVAQLVVDRGEQYNLELLNDFDKVLYSTCYKEVNQLELDLE